MSVSAPITQRDVAQTCGLHPSTVCLALKNSPSIPSETRRRIQAVAAKLGYQPNVAARNLALLRTDRRSAGSLPLAWINQEARCNHWREDPEARLYLDGARRRADENGYHLEEIWTREPGMTAARVVQIIRARGIDGVLFPAHRSFDFSLLNSGWDELSMAGFNDCRLGEWIDVVCPDYFRNTDHALRSLAARDYERIGLVLSTQFDAATHGLVHACYLRHQAELPSADRVPVCFSPANDKAPAAVAEWLRQYEPDAVLCRDVARIDRPRPRQIEPAWVQLHGPTERFAAGIDPCPADIAAAAVDCLIAKMRRFERGVRESTRLHLVKGVWHERNLGRREAETVVA